MACIKSKRLWLQLAIEGWFQKEVQPFLDKIKELEWIKSPNKSVSDMIKWQIKETKSIVEQLLLSSIIKNNPVYRANIIKKYPNMLSAQLLNNFDNLDKLWLWDIISWYNIEWVENAIVDRVVWDIFSSKEWIRKIFKWIPTTKEFEKLKWKPLSEIADTFNLSDWIVDIMKKSNKSLSEYILIRETFWLNDDAVLWLVQDNKWIKSTSSLKIDIQKELEKYNKQIISNNIKINSIKDKINNIWQKTIDNTKANIIKSVTQKDLVDLWFPWWNKWQWIYENILKILYSATSKTKKTWLDLEKQIKRQEFFKSKWINFTKAKEKLLDWIKNNDIQLWDFLNTKIVVDESDIDTIFWELKQTAAPELKLFNYNKEILDLEKNIESLEDMKKSLLDNKDNYIKTWPISGLTSTIRWLNEEDLMPFAILKSSDILKDTKAQKELASRFSKYTWKTIWDEKIVADEILNQINSAKTVDSLIESLKSKIPQKDNSPASSLLQSYWATWTTTYRGKNILWKYIDLSPEITDTASSQASFDSVRTRSFAIWDTTDVIKDIDWVLKWDVLFAKNSIDAKQVRSMLKEKWISWVKVISTEWRQQRSLFSQDWKLYIWFTNELDYKNNLELLRWTKWFVETPAITKEQAKESYIKSLIDGYDWNIEDAKKIIDSMRYEDYISAADANELYTKIVWDWYYRVIDDWVERDKRRLVDDAIVISEWEKLLKSKWIDWYNLWKVDKDYLRNIVYDILYANSPIEKDNLIYNLAESAWSIYNPSSIGIESYYFLKKLQEENIAQVPALADIEKYISFLKWDRPDWWIFFEELLTKNDLWWIQDIEKVKVAQELQKLYNDEIRGKYPIQWVWYEIPSTRWWVRNAFIDIDTSLKQDAINAIIKDSGDNFSYKWMKEGIDKDMKSYNDIFDKYIKEIEKWVKTEREMYELKLKFQVAVDWVERTLYDKYWTITNWNIFKTNRYDIWKLSNNKDIPEIIRVAEWAKKKIESIWESLRKTVSIKEAAKKKWIDVKITKVWWRYIWWSKATHDFNTSWILNQEIRDYAKSIDVSSLNDEEVNALWVYLKWLDDAIINRWNKTINILTMIDPKSSELFANYKVVPTAYWELPYKLSQENRTVLPSAIDKQTKANIFEDISVLMNKWDTLTDDALQSIVSKHSEWENIDLYIQDFKPYQSAFNVPKWLEDLVEVKKPNALQQSILEKVWWWLNDMLLQDPETSLPRILREKNKFQVKDFTSEDINKVRDAFKKIEDSNDAIDAEINRWLHLTASWTLKAYKQQPVVRLIEKMQSIANKASDSIQLITRQNAEEIISKVSSFYSMKASDIDVTKLSDNDKIALPIAQYYKKLSNSVYTDWIWAFASEAFNEALRKKPLENFLSLKPEYFRDWSLWTNSKEVKALHWAVKSSRLIDLVGIDMTKTAAKDFLEAEGFTNALYNKAKWTTRDYKWFESNLSILLWTDIKINDASRIMWWLTDSWDIMRWLRNTIENYKVLRIISALWSSRTWRFVWWLAKQWWLISTIPQIPAFLIKKAALLWRNWKDEIKLMWDIARTFQLNQWIWIKWFKEILNDFKWDFSDYIKLRNEVWLWEDTIWNYALSWTQKRQQIREAVSWLVQSPNNSIESLFVDENRIWHLIQAVKYNNMRRFGSVQDFYEFLSNDKIPSWYKQNLLEEIDTLATKTFISDNWLVQSNIDRINLLSWIWNVPYISKVAWALARATTTPLNFLSWWWDNMVKILWRTFKQTGNLWLYLSKNWFSEQSMKEAEKWMWNNQDYLNIRRQMWLWAYRAVQYSKRINDNDDWPSIDDFTKSMSMLLMPLQWVPTSSFYKWVFKPLMTAFTDWSEEWVLELLQTFQRWAFAQNRILSSIASMSVKMLNASSDEERSQIFLDTREQIWQASARYILDNMWNTYYNYLRPEKWKELQLLEWNSISKDKEVLYKLSWKKLDDYTLSDYIYTALWPLSSLYKLWRDYFNYIENPNDYEAQKNWKNQIWTMNQFQKIITEASQSALLSNWDINQNSKEYAYLREKHFNKVVWKEPSYELSSSIKAYYDWDVVYDQNAKAMIEALENMKWKDYIMSIKNTIDWARSNSQKRDILMWVFNELRWLWVQVPWLNMQMLDAKLYYEYDNRIEQLNKSLSLQNKVFWLKWDNALKLSTLEQNIIKKEMFDEYIKDVRSLDRQWYYNLFIESVINTMPDDKAKRFIVIDDKWKKSLLPKYKRQLSDEIETKRALEEWTVWDYYRSNNSVFHTLFMQKDMSVEDKVSMLKRVNWYIDWSDIDPIDKFNLKSSLLLQQSSLLTNPTEVTAALWEGAYNDLASYWYWTFQEWAEIMNALSDSESNAKMLDSSSWWRRWLWWVSKVAVKLTSNFEKLNKIMKAADSEMVKLWSIPTAIKPIDLSKFWTSKKAEPINMLWVSSSESRIEKIERITDKKWWDIKRFYKVKKIKWPKKVKSKSAA